MTEVRDEVLISVDAAENGPSPTNSAPISPPPNPIFSCEMCHNYEVSLNNAQEGERKLKEELQAVRSLAERYEAELVEERQYRQNLERKMTETAATTEERVNECTRSSAALASQLEEALKGCGKARNDTKALLENSLKAVADLEKENERLSSRLSALLALKAKTAGDMRAEAFDIPRDVDTLQYMYLQLHEELIEDKAAREFKEVELIVDGEIVPLQDELAVMEAELKEEKSLRERRETELVAQINNLTTTLGIANSHISTSEEVCALSEDQKRQIKELQGTVEELESQVQQVQSERATLEITTGNFRTRCSALQHELDVSEQVQKDFVQLSQSLQIQLEKIRQSDQEVRWQWEDEVSECSSPTCSTSVARLRPKPRCYHCGKIFCQPCVSATVPSGIIYLYTNL